MLPMSKSLEQQVFKLDDVQFWMEQRVCKHEFEQLCCLWVISDVNAGAVLASCRLQPQKP